MASGRIMTGLHWGKQGAQHPETDSSVEGGVYGALTDICLINALNLRWKTSFSLVNEAWSAVVSLACRSY
ncbi:hypothetical protein PXNS11_200003 [Stutzerimonas xanthomarina]|nr:hypothetical protein PXNS11_200003 [Stutzerimonas xanthomarina]